MLLIACDQCDRQYDVSHLTPADLVHCVCDAMLVVGARSPLTVEALCCSNCGGVVKPEDEACPYCQAKLSEADRRASTLCPKCFTRVDDEAKHCNGCGIAIAPTALTPLPPERACPACDGELAHRPLAGSDAVECQGCRGLWVTRDVFEALCRDAVTDGLPTLGERKNEVTLDPQERVRAYVPCMSCRELMQRRMFRWGRRGSGVVIDQCQDHGVWLDDRELEKIVAYLREGGGGPMPQQPQQRRSSGRKAPPFLPDPKGTRALGYDLTLPDVVRTLASWLF